jgi:hypothetical protein
MGWEADLRAERPFPGAEGLSAWAILFGGLERSDKINGLQ